MILDLLAHNNWKRPVCFAISVSRDNYLNLESYFQLEGMVYHVVPIRSEIKKDDVSGIDTKVMYDNMMNKFRWGGINNSKVYLDENNMQMLYNLKNNFAKLANALIRDGKSDSALIVLDKSIEVMPNETAPYNYSNIPIADCYYRLNKTNKANDIIKILGKSVMKELSYYLNLPIKYKRNLSYEEKFDLQLMQQLVQITKMYKQDSLNNYFEKHFQEFLTKYSQQQ
jgi:hypothetical protein